MSDSIQVAKFNPDWKARKNAVEKITDEDVLKDIFINDSVVMVKITAMRRIRDIDFLYDECLNNPQGHVRMAILNHLLDENLLEEDSLNLLLRHLALNDPEDAVCQVACENLSPDCQNVFAQLSKSQRDVKLRCEAISRINDEDLLKDLAINDENRFIRLEAIRNPNLANVEALAEIIEKEDNEFNRILAIMKIPDCESLIEIIFEKSLYPRLGEIANNISFSPEEYFKSVLKDDSDSYKRIVAVNFIQDTEILEHIVLNSNNEKLIAQAIGNANFKNQEILRGLIEGGCDEDILLRAIDKMDDENVLIDFLKGHPFAFNPTFKAILKITDFGFLCELYASQNPQIQFHAAKQMIRLEYNLPFIAMQNTNIKIRLEAIETISDKYVLAEIASKTKDKNIIMASLNTIIPDKLIQAYLPSTPIIADSLNDMTFKRRLWNLAAGNEYREIQKLAVSRLNDKNMLDEIISNNSDAEIVDAARKRLATLFEDIKLISDEEILNVIGQKGDEDIKSAVSAQIEDLKTWKNRISQINDISDIDKLKDIANNDYNYFVRCEAEGKLESLIFNIRLDEIKLSENQDRFRKIAADETYPLEIRKKAGLNCI